jgi:hypothetical protein
MDVNGCDPLESLPSGRRVAEEEEEEEDAGTRSDNCLALRCLRDENEGVIGDGRVLLPFADREREEGEERADAEFGRSKGGGRTILRVDDDEDEDDGTAMLAYAMLDLAVFKESTGLVEVEDGGGTILNNRGAPTGETWSTE